MLFSSTLLGLLLLLFLPLIPTLLIWARDTVYVRTTLQTGKDVNSALHRHPSSHSSIFFIFVAFYLIIRANETLGIHPIDERNYGSCTFQVSAETKSRFFAPARREQYHSEGGVTCSPPLSSSSSAAAAARVAHITRNPPGRKVGHGGEKLQPGEKGRSVQKK